MKEKKDIPDLESFESHCTDLLDDFVRNLPFGRYKRKPTEDEREESGENWAYVMTYKGMQLYDRYKSRLLDLGIKLYGEYPDINDPFYEL